MGVAKLNPNLHQDETFGFFYADSKKPIQSCDDSVSGNVERKKTMRNLMLAAGLACCTTLGAIAPTALATTASEQVAAEGQLERATMIQLLKPVTVELTDQRFEDVVTYLIGVTGADIQVHWLDDTHAIGLDPDQPINLKARNASALSILERALEQSASAFGEPGSATWQFTQYGSFEIGPKERLNGHRRVELYDINDLLMEIPDFADAPTFDLNSVLQGSGGRGGGGGGRSPFGGGAQDQQRERVPRAELAEDVISIITDIVETEQWELNGGDGATIRYYDGHLLVNGPDYVHRGLNGYSWWPKRLSLRAHGSMKSPMTFTSDELRKKKDSQLIDPTVPQRPARGQNARPARKPADG